MAAAELKCSFSGLFSSLKCGVASSYAHETNIVNLLACTKDTGPHLARLHLQKSEISTEWKLLLARTGKFDFESPEYSNLTVCPSHRYKLGLCWTPSRACKHPLHHGKGKPTRAVVRLEVSRFIQRRWNTLVPIGSGICKNCWSEHQKAVSSEPSSHDVPLPVPVPDDIPLPVPVPDVPLSVRTVLESTPAPGTSTSTIHDIPQPQSTPIAHIPINIQPSGLDSSSEESSLDLAQVSGLEESESGSEVEMTDVSWAPTPAPNKPKLSVLNTFLSDSGYEPVKSQLKTPLIDTSARTVRYYKQKAVEGISLTLHYLAPGQEDKLMNIVRKALASENGDDKDVITETLINCYENATYWHTKRQILSIFASKFTKNDLLAMISGLTIYRIDMARKHAKEAGQAQPVELEPITRSRLDNSKVGHFLDFISRPDFLQDVAFGTKKMKLSHGESLEIPNVVRTVIASRLIKLYENYCAETHYTALKRTTLYNILNVCSASKKVSLAGLDNLAAEGANGFQTLSILAKSFSELGKSSVWYREIEASLKQAHLYLKTDYKLHLTKESNCEDHCLTFSLSEKKSCAHQHDMECSSCENLRIVLEALTNIFDDPEITYKYPKQKEEMKYDFDRAKESVLNFKSHCLRSVNQELCKVNILDNLGPNDALLTMDWAMKFLPTKYREAQQEWFAKKGISWHVSAVVTKMNNEFVIHCFVHLIEKSCSQNWFSVISVLESTTAKLKEIRSHIKNLFVRSDNAGCYHSASTILSLPALGKRQNVDFKRYDFSEAQAGKDICDRKIAGLKSHILRYVNEGHDVTNAEQMMAACQSYGGVRGCYVTVLTLNEGVMNSNPPTWAGITKYNNFSYEKDGIRAWNAYDIGAGTHFPYSKLFKKADVQGPTSYNVLPYHMPLVATGSVQANLPTKEKFACTEETCDSTFTTEEGMAHHLSIGKHTKVNVTDSRLDKIARDWQSRVTELSSTS